MMSRYSNNDGMSGFSVFGVPIYVSCLVLLFYAIFFQKSGTKMEQERGRRWHGF